jgi:enolase
MIDKEDMSTAVGDEGGFAPNLASNEAVSSTSCARSRRPGTSPDPT